MPAHEDELGRIRKAYEHRDVSAAASGRAAWTPEYTFYLQQLEWTLLKALERHECRVPDAAVLEVGCGTGYFLHRFREYGAARTAGIDLMEHRIAEAQSRYPGLELVAGDAAAMPWPDECFDVVTQLTCLSSVLDGDLRARIAADMWRVLKPGGCIVSYDMRPPTRSIRALQALQHRGRRPPEPATPTTSIGADELRRLFPLGDVQARPVTAEASLRHLAARGRWLAEAASSVPSLTTHLLAVIQKPAD